jgi:hypothetical protein
MTLLVAAGLPTFVPAQSKKVYRIGWLGTIDTSKEPYDLAFVDQLRSVGFAEGDTSF